jgi:hypothetical protein
LARCEEFDVSSKQPGCFVIVVALGCLGSAGCGDPHRDLIQKQIRDMNGLADVLAKVRDEKTMSEFEDQVYDRAAALRKTIDEIRNLPRPEAANTEHYQREFEQPLTTAHARFGKELDRVETLPGGKKFAENVTQWFPRPETGGIR